VDVVAAIVMAMAKIVVGASTIVMATSEIVVAASTIVMVKAEIVLEVLPFGWDLGDYRRSASSSWPEVLPNYLTRRPFAKAAAELVSLLPPPVAFVLLVVVVVNAFAIIATDVDGPKF